MDLNYNELKEEKNRLVKLQTRLYEIKHIKEQAQQWCNDLKYENIILELSEEKRKEFYRDIIEVIYVSDYEYHIIFKHPFMMVQEVYCEPENNLSTSRRHIEKGSRIALYARYSTGKQDENAQIHDVRKFYRIMAVNY